LVFFLKSFKNKNCRVVLFDQTETEAYKIGDKLFLSKDLPIALKESLNYEAWVHVLRKIVPLSTGAFAGTISAWNMYELVDIFKKDSLLIFTPSVTKFGPLIDVAFFHENEKSDLVGAAKFSYHYWLPFKDSHLFASIAGEQIVRIWILHSQIVKELFNWESNAERWQITAF